jgi:hypothetical protein
MLRASKWVAAVAQDELGDRKRRELLGLQTRPVQQLDQGTIPQRRRRRGALEIEDTPYLASREYRLRAVVFLIVERRAGRPWVRLGARKTP